ncbi:MAG: glycosyltransferase [Planctomycetota bacterium]
MTDHVSLVIPGRDCARTIRQCLGSVVPLLEQPDCLLTEIIFVDDGSTDGTREIVGEFPVTLLDGVGRGAGAARNLGWRTANHALIWFIDSDCVAEPDALARLLPDMSDKQVGGVGGSYGNMAADSLLGCLIHEEIVERHRAMPKRVNFLATFNVLYRRSILEQIGGFDERFLKGQDAELAFRVMEAGYELRFEIDSRVKHFHPTRLWSYLRTQRQQGYWRVWLHLRHHGHSRGDSYSSLLDHVQPPLAVLAVAALPLMLVPSSYFRWIAPVLLLLLGSASIPMTLRLLARLREPRYLLYAVMSFVRAFWRGLGMVHGTLAYLGRRE